MLLKDKLLKDSFTDLITTISLSTVNKIGENIMSAVSSLASQFKAKENGGIESSPPESVTVAGTSATVLFKNKTKKTFTFPSEEDARGFANAVSDVLI